MIGGEPTQLTLVDHMIMTTLWM